MLLNKNRTTHQSGQSVGPAGIKAPFRVSVITHTITSSHKTAPWQQGRTRTDSSPLGNQSSSSQSLAESADITSTASGTKESTTTQSPQSHASAQDNSRRTRLSFAGASLVEEADPHMTERFAQIAIEPLFRACPLCGLGIKQLTLITPNYRPSPVPYALRTEVFTLVCPCTLKPKTQTRQPVQETTQQGSRQEGARHYSPVERPRRRQTPFPRAPSSYSSPSPPPRRRRSRQGQ